MALEDLIQVLRRDTEAEATAVEAAARAEAAAIRERAEAEASARRAELQADRDAARRAAVELALTAARREGRCAVLQARDRLLQRAFATARARFAAALDTPEFRSALPDQLTEALACLGGRPGRLRTHPAIRDEIGRLLPPHAAVQLDSDPDVGAGFKLASEDGSVEIDATLEDRLTRLAPRIRQAVMARLEAEP